MTNKLNYLLASFLLLALISCQPHEQDLQILVTTDVHGAFFPNDPVSGKKSYSSLAKASTYMKNARKANPNEVIALDNGDIIQGDPSVYYFNFEQCSEEHIFTKAMRFLHYNAATIGNHDIEAGHPVYDRINNELTIPWMAANCINTETGKPYFTPYTIIRQGKIKIAVLGLTTPWIPHWLPENIWSGMRFDDMIETAAHWVPLIQKKEKPDLMVGLFHSGVDFNYNNLDENTPKNENATRLVARQVAGFDVIFAGHDHNTWNFYEADPNGDSVLILGSQSKARELAEANVHFKKEGRKWMITNLEGKNIRLDTIKPDPDFAKHFSKEIKEIQDYVNQDLGELMTSLSSSEAFFGPSAFMTLIHQVQLDISGADISFAAPLSFNTTIKPKTLTMNDLFDLYRFENLLYTMELSGQEILDYLNYSYSLWFNSMKGPNDHLIKLEHDQRGWFHTVSAYYNFDSAEGIDYQVDVSKKSGEMVTIMKLSNGNPFDLHKKYKVAINSYRGNGGGRHLTSGAGITEDELSKRLVSSTDKDLRFYMKEWIINKGTIKVETVNNWKIVPEAWAKKGTDKDYSILFRK
ncbi:MAG: bifunctional metallophosphatase/5'-nucleotidase [Bacteroidales bacterium]|nr:bifunctional metallophosphatase/5'-nucleotidase [Bacteroidales bacterium]